MVMFAPSEISLMLEMIYMIDSTRGFMKKNFLEL